MDEKEIARIAAESIKQVPQALGIVRGYNMILVSSVASWSLSHNEQLRIREALQEAERRTQTSLGMVRFL
jgi:hypothetical protein